MALVDKHYAEAKQMVNRALTTYSGIDQQSFEGSTLAKLGFVARIEGDYRRRCH